MCAGAPLAAQQLHKCLLSLFHPILHKQAQSCCCTGTDSSFSFISGTEAWPPGVCLKYVGGDQFGHVNMVMVRSLEPQEMADVSVQMCSPSTAGMYQGQWRMCTATGLYYGGECPLCCCCSLCPLAERPLLLPSASADSELVRVKICQFLG